MAALVRALDELPPRCRAIFIAARLDEVPHKALAERYGISMRTVERELKRAMEHCGERLGRISPRRVGSPPSEPSI
jgi:RNA polymerase sigma-70 factor (ECF subfamily)